MECNKKPEYTQANVFDEILSYFRSVCLLFLEFQTSITYIRPRWAHTQSVASGGIMVYMDIKYINILLLKCPFGMHSVAKNIVEWRGVYCIQLQLDLWRRMKIVGRWFLFYFQNAKWVWIKKNKYVKRYAMNCCRRGRWFSYSESFSRKKAFWLCVWVCVANKLNNAWESDFCWCQTHKKRAWLR